MTDSSVWNNADQAYETVRERDAQQGLIWLQPASANNTWAMSVREDLAEENELVSLEDLAAYLADGESSSSPPALSLSSLSKLCLRSRKLTVLS
ncbi:hypothetical protein HORIV_33720 [Vreelandella olivaria]|uniref:ABC-type glycine betaine transport system substrate-binding domain-containing protein n=1 Tax=Vreelandella olivaria TaxID=390919 RepID=A0ABM7GK52_9GAMM|nr:hypothetical protein HORIV_33720 [Halomonas olivaria]